MLDKNVLHTSIARVEIIFLGALARRRMYRRKVLAVCASKSYPKSIPISPTSATASSASVVRKLCACARKKHIYENEDNEYYAIDFTDWPTASPYVRIARAKLAFSSGVFAE